jgi:hypothetical protein
MRLSASAWRFRRQLIHEYDLRGAAGICIAFAEATPGWQRSSPDQQSRAFPVGHRFVIDRRLAKYALRCIFGYYRSLGDNGPMIDEPPPPARSNEFSRRTLLRGAVRAAGAAAMLGAAANPALAKISQAAVAYQPQPNGDKSCDKCAQFLPPNACKIIDGAISPQGWCRVFVPAPR